jgi:hypothetical protein
VSNHYHLLMETPEPNLVAGMKWFQGQDARSLIAYRERLERFMRFELDPAAGIRGEVEKQMKRGWYIGSPDFMAKLNGFLEGQPRSDNYRGHQRRDHSIREAERLWSEGVKLLGVEESDLLRAKSTRMEKQALAWLMKTYTSVTGAWIAERTDMGHLSTVSVAIKRFGNNTSREAKRIRDLLVSELIET